MHQSSTPDQLSRCYLQVLQNATYLLPNQDLAVVAETAYLLLVFQLSGSFRNNIDTFMLGLG